MTVLITSKDAKRMLSEIASGTDLKAWLTRNAIEPKLIQDLIAASMRTLKEDGDLGALPGTIVTAFMLGWELGAQIGTAVRCGACGGLNDVRERGWHDEGSPMPTCADCGGPSDELARTLSDGGSAA